ncbi:MAG TPA: response regulator, partial [Kiloniellales bacterium]|nr:response regulator [Kiloniellales bacterium]
MSSDNKRLLTIDDDTAICRTIDLVARTTGFEARSTSDTSEFFRLVEEWRPSHLVLDLVMPGLDG